MAGAVIPDGGGALTNNGRSICLPDSPEWAGLITGQLLEMTNPRFWDAETGDVSAAVATAYKILYSWIDKDCGMPDEREFRELPNGTLQTRSSPTAQWETIFETTEYITTLAETVANDTAIDGLGEFRLQSQPDPDPGQNTRAYKLYINQDKLKGDKGDKGDTGGKGDKGDKGDTGHGIEFTDPSVEVENPNVAPYLEEDNALPSKTFVKAHLPRAQKMYFLPTITGLPGSAASVATALDTNGDLNVQMTIPAGQDGSGQDYGIDDLLPEENQTKSYRAIVDADTGALLPFQLQPGMIIKNISPKGIWAVSGLDLGTLKELPCAASGLGAEFGDSGKLIVQRSRESDNTFNFLADYDGGDITIEDAEYIRLMQKRVGAQDYGIGYIQVDYEIFRPYTPRTDFFRLAILQSSPDRYWRCNELSGTSLIDLIANHTLALSGSYSLAQSGAFTGDDHRSIRFNGGQAKGDPLSFLVGDGAYTIEALVKFSGRTAWFWHGADNSTSDDILAGYASGYGIGHYWNGGSNNLVASLSNPSQWHHVVLTYDQFTPKTRVVYVDGQNVASDAVSSRSTPSNSHTWIGRDYFQGSDCNLSEVAVYDVPLAANVVAEHYAAYLQSVQGHA